MPIEVKYAHVSLSPSRARSVAPSTRVRPPVPMTSAATIRGDVPRPITSTPRRRPFTSPPSRACAALMLIRIGPQRWRGEASSYGSSTAFSHGSGRSPSDVFSTSSVMPPEVEKKYVVTGEPLWVTTWPRVAATAASVDGVSAATPP